MNKIRKIRIYLPQYGQVKVYDADHLPIIPGVFDAPILENCSTACLEALQQRVAATREAEGKSREEQRADLRATATKARGYEIFREGDTTSLESNNLPSGPTSASTDRGGGSVPVAESTRQLGIDPSTGNYYSPIAIKKLFTTNPHLIRTMMRTRLHFTNRLLNASN